VIRLDKGRHRLGDGRGCLMEWKMMLCACKECTDLRADGELTDSPPCSNAVITSLVQAVQDRLPDDERQQLLAFAERIDRCRRTSADQRINVRLAIWLARQILHLVPEGEDRPRLAIEAAEAWLANPCEETVSAAAHAAERAHNAYATYDAATDAASAASAAYAADAAAYAAAYAANAAACAAACDAACDADLPALLDGLLDQWPKAAAEEGVIWEGGDEWADEFAAFAEAWSAATAAG